MRRLSILMENSGIRSALFALNVFALFQREYSMSSRDESTANTIFMSCLHLVAENAVRFRVKLFLFLFISRLRDKLISIMQEKPAQR